MRLMWVLGWELRLCSSVAAVCLSASAAAAESEQVRAAVAAGGCGTLPVCAPSCGSSCTSCHGNGNPWTHDFLHNGSTPLVVGLPWDGAVYGNRRAE